ncbi:purple acid phosphatase-1 [Coleophoma cylindrospora]|uniref:Purple acid phosphatase n=1 Tax=Coleophoma cylindrospora TaxID=1849047 RepID=A0A3D8Q3U6_9HELO|nr:purple acid phosphatase-1 [Coleophoma cylindrospora]
MRFSNSVGAAATLVALAAPAKALLYNVSLNSQVRMAFDGQTGMTVSWNTYEQLSSPTVMWGSSPDQLVNKATSDVSITYATSLTYDNHVTISGLKPNTKYYYMPLDMLKDQYTRAPYSFTTGRVAGDMTPYTAAVVIDLGTVGAEGLSTTPESGVAANNLLKPGQQTTIASMAKSADSYEFVVHPGDMAYADYWLKEEYTGYINVSMADGYKAYESILDAFYDELTPVTTQKPYMVGPGNHEANCDNGGYKTWNTSICVPGQLNFTGYINHFRMPSEKSGGVGNFWYSYDHGMTHYVIVDMETDFGNGISGPSEPISGPFGQTNEQYNWLENDLKSVDRSVTPWLVVFGHRPWYTSGALCLECQEAFEPLFDQYNVDLYMSGHNHYYERIAPIANNVTDPNELNNPSAPWHIINGAAGHWGGLDSFDTTMQNYSRFGLDSTEGIYGWSKLTFHNCTHMTHEYVASVNGTVLDTATLYKQRTCDSTCDA